MLEGGRKLIVTLLGFFPPSSPSLVSYLEHVNLMKVSTLNIISRVSLSLEKKKVEIISILAPGFSYFLALKVRFRLESLLKSAGQEQLY